MELGDRYMEYQYTLTAALRNPPHILLQIKLYIYLGLLIKHILRNKSAGGKFGVAKKEESLQ